MTRADDFVSCDALEVGDIIKRGFNWREIKRIEEYAKTRRVWLKMNDFGCWDWETEIRRTTQVRRQVSK